MIINLEEYIAIKGIKALGNKLTTDKIRTVDMLEPLAYEPPIIEDVEVTDEEVIDNTVNVTLEIENPVIEKDAKIKKDTTAEEDGQITLF